MELYYLYYPNTLVSLGSSVVFRHQHLPCIRCSNRCSRRFLTCETSWPMRPLSAELRFRCQWTVQLADACCIRYTEIANMKKTKSQFEQEAGVAMHLLDPFGVSRRCKANWSKGGTISGPCRVPVPVGTTAVSLACCCDMIFVPVQVLAPNRGHPKHEPTVGQPGCFAEPLAQRLPGDFSSDSLSWCWRLYLQLVLESQDLAPEPIWPGRGDLTPLLTTPSFSVFSS